MATLRGNAHGTQQLTKALIAANWPPMKRGRGNVIAMPFPMRLSCLRGSNRNDF